MNTKDFTAQYNEHNKHGIVYTDPKTGFIERTMLYSGIQHNVDGGEFLRIGGINSGVLLEHVVSIKDLGVPW